jgi:hypothetical protein
MATQISIPGLVRICIADRPGEIIALANNPGLLRGGETIGPLVNRFVLGNIDRALRYRDRQLPSAEPRDDLDRAADQEALAARLDPAKIDWSIVPVAELAAYVRGDQRYPLGPLCQKAAGRVFWANYETSRSIWAAARTLDAAVRSLNPLAHLWWRLSGSLRRAQKKLFDASGGDTACMHATGVAVHTLVAAVDRLRLALAEPEARRYQTLGEIFGKALLGPTNVVRHTRTFVDDVPGLALKPGTLVLLQTAKANALTVDKRVTFMAPSWSACPADRFVPALLAKIWEQASGGETLPPITAHATRS